MHSFDFMQLLFLAAADGGWFRFQLVGSFPSLLSLFIGWWS